MAKKIKNKKLLRTSNPKTKSIHPQNSTKSTTKSAFNNFATKLQHSKQKKLEKLGDTKQRLQRQRKNNKMISVSGTNQKKIKKFALLDDDEGQENNKLTHRGKDFKDIKHFNDMNFVEDDWDHDGEFDQMQDKINFQGFDQSDKEGEVGNSDRPKSKNQVYKQIIDKSRKYKKQRQDQYQQNFEKAVQLDENYENIREHLKFRSQASKTQDKIKNTDKQYEKLMNQLRQDQRVIANRVIVNDGKGKQKTSKRKNQQLKKLLRANRQGSSDQDVRGWVQGVSSDDQDEGSSNSSEQEQDSQQEDEGGLQSNDDNEESEEDELDDIQLSSGDQEDQDELQDDDEKEEDSQQENGEQDQQISSNQFQIVEQSSSQEVKIPVKMGKKQRKNLKIQQKNNSKH